MPLSKGSSRNARERLSSATSGSCSKAPTAAAAAAASAAAADVQASRVNRTLLLELMHEDDVSRTQMSNCSRHTDLVVVTLM